MAEPTIKARLVLDASSMTRLASAGGMGGGESSGVGGIAGKSANNILSKYVKPVMSFMLVKLSSGTMFKPVVDAVMGVGKVAGNLLMKTLNVKNLGELGTKIWGGFSAGAKGAGKLFRSLGSWIYSGLQSALVAGQKIWSGAGKLLSKSFGDSAALLPWAGWGALIAGSLYGTYLLVKDVVNRWGSMIMKGGKEGIVAAQGAKDLINAPDKASKKGGIGGVFGSVYNAVGGWVTGGKMADKKKEFNDEADKYIKIQEDSIAKTDAGTSAFERFTQATDTCTQQMSIRNDKISEGIDLANYAISIAGAETTATLTTVSSKDKEASARNRNAEAIRNEANAIKKLRSAKGETGRWDSNLGDSKFNMLHAKNMSERQWISDEGSRRTMKYAGSSISVKKGSDLDKFYNNPDKYYEDLNSKNKFSVSSWAYRGGVPEVSD